MFLASVVAILVLDAVLVAVTWLFITVIWNTIVREKLQIRNNLDLVSLLGITVAIVNAVNIAAMSQVQGILLLLALVAALLVLDVGLATFTWLLISRIWNNVVRERFKVRSNLLWAWLFSIVVAIANAAIIAVLLQ